MNNIKKITSLVICFAMVLGCVFVQADTKQTTEVFGEYEMGFTNALEITDIEDVAELTTDLTKGEFYKMICTLASINPVDSPETVFADLKPGDEAEPYAKALVKAGYISADASGNVYADKPISYQEAVALVVNVLGYAPKAKAEGGYPTGYVTVANRLKLNEGLSAGKTLTVGEGVVLIFNSFTVNMMLPKYIPGSSPKEFYVSEDTTILTSSFGAYWYEGLVEGVDITRIAGENDVKPYCMDISGVTFDIGNLENPYDYLGYEVELIYLTKRGVDPMIVHIGALSTNSVTEISIEAITEISSGKVTAYTGASSKKKSYSFEKAVPVVYNGAATEKAFNKELIEGKTGNVKLLDNDGNNTADVVFVDAYENFYVGYVDVDNFIVFDKYNKSNAICLDLEKDDPYVNLYDASGSAVTFNSVKKGMVISVYRSLDDAYQGFINAYVCKDAVVGEVEAVDTGDRKVTVSGNEYEVTKAAYAEISSMLKPGVSVKLLMDISGKVAAGEIESDPTFSYGFLLGTNNKETGFDKKVSFRIFTSDNEFVVYPAAYNVRIDGIKYKNTDSDLINPVLHEAAVKMYGESVKNDLEFRASAVKYAVNSNGEIAAVDTILDGDTMEIASRATETSYKDTLFASYSIDSVKCRTYSSGKYLTVGPKITVDGNKTAMFVPTADEIFDEKEYSADLASNLISNEKDYANIWALYSDKKEARAEFVVVVGSAATGGDPHSSVRMGIVTGTSKVLGEEGEEKICVSVLHDGAEKKLIAADNITIKVVPNVTFTASDLIKGDVIRYSTNSKEEISTVHLYYRCATNQVGHVAKKGFGEQISIRTGYVYETLNEGFVVCYTDKIEDLEQVDYDDEKMEFVTTAVVTSYFYEYDSTNIFRPEVKSSSPDALRGYTDVGNECSRIVIHQYYGIPYAVVISD